MKIRLLTRIGVVLVASMPASAQGPGIVGPRPSALYASAIPQDTAHHQAVVYNWQEPALIGGALLGSFVNLVGYGFCADGEASGANSCALGGEMGFLTGATVGGGIAGLIGSTSKPRVAPPGYVRDGDRRVYGALMLAVPSLAIDAYGFAYECDHPHFLSTRNGCNAGNLLFVLMAGALNAWIGAQIGKGIPSYRPSNP